MISVIIPSQDDLIALAAVLSALVPAATEGIVTDVLVVDEGSRDGTLELADAAGCTIIAEDGNGVRRAANAARSEWLLFLSPTASPEPGWQAEALAFIDRAVLAGEGRSCAAAFSYAGPRSGIRGRLRTILRRRFSRTPAPEQGLLIPRALFLSLSSRRASENYCALARRIGRRSLTILRARVVTLNLA